MTTGPIAAVRQNQTGDYFGKIGRQRGGKWAEQWVCETHEI